MGGSATRHILTLGQTVTYEIVVSGPIGDDWSGWIDPETRVESCESGSGTRITGAFDQAGLHGLLRRLYSVGLPLLSVRMCPQNHETEKKS